MPITMNDYANLIQDDLALGLYKNLVRMSDVLKLFPVVEVGAFVVTGQRWSTLPTHDFRKLNASFTESTGTTEPTEDRLAIFGGKFTADEAFAQASKLKLFRDPVQQQFDMHTVAMERGLMDNVINGDIDTEPDGFNGLFKRVDTAEFPARQRINWSDTASYDVLTDATHAQQFFKKLDLAMFRAGLWGATKTGGAKGALLMNSDSFLGIQDAARLAGYSLYTKDVLGYTWQTYRDVPLVDVGYKRDMSTEIILNTYNPGDAGNDCTRIYCVRFTEPDGEVESPGSDGLTLVQAGTFRRLGPVETLTAKEYGMEWILGLAHVGDDYCVSLLEEFAWK